MTHQNVGRRYSHGEQFEFKRSDTLDSRDGVLTQLPNLLCQPASLLDRYILALHKALNYYEDQLLDPAITSFPYISFLTAWDVVLGCGSRGRGLMSGC